MESPDARREIVITLVVFDRGGAGSTRATPFAPGVDHQMSDITNQKTYSLGAKYLSCNEPQGYIIYAPKFPIQSPISRVTHPSPGAVSVYTVCSAVRNEDDPREDSSNLRTDLTEECAVATGTCSTKKQRIPDALHCIYARREVMS